ncbi:4-hydroxyphenylacetate 3-hydroxylase N-terminal domain-containing protein [Paenibacillus sp. JX-17]|uniref:4-hydroxyphenylacetate 3-hydroxylase N-terminal domain-containing protein n=1 Tax=Paenibacillus lacisoli TaxID=3064525 RepID=A0ABT9CAV0_9BACL|nr:4-hydroxyphenylacetate 3-hydroxylase N-terminal domain-containing protein [Paenibacillus sp. JX-17]MDO7906377.1 4-hydroxyphenylacetate 3-hydroxylase N-terminal domain-containing protein [Paenibacillus sp. JX-17]
MSGKTRGQAFVESLMDGRNVWLQGERVENVGLHPAFEGTLSTIGRLFDMLDHPDHQQKVGYIPEDGGRYAHSSFLLPRDAAQLEQRRHAFAVWAGDTYGAMSRLSDYARSRVTGWYGDREEIGRGVPHFAGKMESYYREARDRDLFMTTALRDPQIDRSKGLEDEHLAEHVLHVVSENEEGLVLRGAKMIATGAPYCHDFLVFPFHKVAEDKPGHAHAMIVPANLPGLHMVCRDSFAAGNDREQPLSARYDEMDAVLIFDDVLVPWERVLIHRDPEAVWRFRCNPTANALAFHQTVVRLQAKLEFVAGLAMAVAEAIGAEGFLHVQEKLGELMVQVETIQALLIASEAGASGSSAGIWTPSLRPLETARLLGTKYYPRALEVLQLIGAGGFIQVPSTLDDLYGPIGGLIGKYYGGASVAAEEKVKLFKLAWDLLGSPFGSRHELYERFYAGDPLRAQAGFYTGADKASWTRPVKELLAGMDSPRSMNLV